MNFLEEAKRRWKDAKVLGSGRYAVVGQNGGLIYLAATEQQQRSIALGVERPELVDLVPTPIPDIADDWEDRQYERRQKRMEKFPK